jgi:hypothetical protein
VRLCLEAQVLENMLLEDNLRAGPEYSETESFAKFVLQIQMGRSGQFSMIYYKIAEFLWP